MYDLHFKFQEDRTKTAVAIVDDRYFTQRDRQTCTQVTLNICPTHCIALDDKNWQPTFYNNV